MGRGPSEKDGLKKGPWTAEEDKKLIEYIKKHGHGRWGTVPKGAGLNRCGKSCRLRWTNYLRPDIKRGKFTFEEEETIIQLHSILGNKWSAIADRLPGRTDNEIKNYWNTHIRKRLLKMGIDPVTHKPRLDLLELYNSILNSSLITSSPQVNFQNLPGLIQTSLNSNLLNLITSLALSQCNNGLQYLPQNLQVLNQDNNNILHVQNQFQPCLSPLFNQAPSTDLSQNSLPNIYQHELQKESMFSKVMIHVQRESGMAQNHVPVQDVDSGNDHFDYSFVKLLSDDEMLQNSNKSENNLKYGFGSVMSTPISSSTPVNSSTTFVNGSSCAEDEKDSYCSNIMSQISHPLDLDNFLCNQL